MAGVWVTGFKQALQQYRGMEQASVPLLTLLLCEPVAGSPEEKSV
jgi:hypothetical protein